MAVVGKKEQIQLDIDELKSFELSSKRDNVKKLLSAEIINLEKKKELLIKQEVVPKQTNYIIITNYCWDQSNDFVKIYITLEKNHEITSDSVTLSFPTKKSLMITYGKFKFQLSKLNKEIDVEKSYYKIKNESLLLMIKKSSSGSWSDIHETVNKMDKLDDKVSEDDPSGGLMKLMKKMYDEGDDNMKRTINKSWYEAQSKKESGTLPSYDD